MKKISLILLFTSMMVTNTLVLAQQADEVAKNSSLEVMSNGDLPEGENQQINEDEGYGANDEEYNKSEAADEASAVDTNSDADDNSENH